MAQPKVKKPRKKIDFLAAHEFLDRTTLVIEFFDNALNQHALGDHPKLKKKLAKAEKTLFKLHTEIQGIVFSDV